MTKDYEQIKRESLNLMVTPFYSEEALQSFRSWLSESSDLAGSSEHTESRNNNSVLEE